ncbi:MAG: hypothetical protein GYA60_04925 [Candidatus Methanofastidiosa archaeon]|nr:hypothetical protein [Candidatus Methanofastidiosa archaeon]
MSKYLYGVAAFVLAFAILSVSILRSCFIPKAYGFDAPKPKVSPEPTPTINYIMPYPGQVLPDNALWYIKALRDKIQYFVTVDKLKRADLALLYADKRLSSSLILFQNKKPDIALTTLTKGEKYLEEALMDEANAKKAGMNTNDYLIKLANASLRHRQIIEENIMPLAPEDLKPEIVKSEDYAKNTYKNTRDILNNRGITPPKDPFDGQ